MELKALFDDFFSFESISLTNNENPAINTLHGNASNDENTRYNNDKNNSKGLANAVTTVTTVTAKNTTELVDCNRNTYLHNNLYRLYEGGDTWARNNCMDRGDK